QTCYFERIIKKFHMEDAKTVKTPFAPHFKLTAAQSPADFHELTEMKAVPYANLVGSLMYGMVCSRPDLAHAMSVVSRYMSNPGRPHWEASKWILRYVKGTSNKGLVFTKSDVEGDILTGFVDSDYAADLDKRRSLSGYIFTLFGNVVSWRSTLQTVVALSSTEAEYIALAESVKEAVWLKGSVSAMYHGKCAVEIHCDSQSALAL
ncbi:MAG: Ty1/Copia family ribonuclease HI, partial [Sweet potato little leaf phytoplasma]|nr:Ty1/Copia family ribonuclease HI [Sweet potato little leaf phytoplasma]